MLLFERERFASDKTEIMLRLQGGAKDTKCFGRLSCQYLDPSGWQVGADKVTRSL